MTRDLILRLLSELDQDHLKYGLDALSKTEQEQFYQQLLSFGKMLLLEQREALRKMTEHKVSPQTVSPLKHFQDNLTQACVLEGEKKLREGKVGCLILAGGQGTRLGIPSGKGFAPITPIKQKTLFQFAFEKAHCASQASGCSLPIAVMASPINRVPIENYLQQNGFFEISENDVDILEQQMVPFIDHEGDWSLQAPGKLATGPNGNGEALQLFYQSGAWEKWRSKGIEAVQVILIDNPLADPFLCPLVGFHALNEAEITVLATPRRDQLEKVGVLANSDEKVAVVEYTEASLPLVNYPYANTGIFIFSMDFIKKIAHAILPWHLSLKKADTLNAEKMLWKSEKFLFDVFPLASHVEVLVRAREDCFAPLKNAVGEDSFQTVRKALVNRDRQILSQMIGAKIHEDLEIELDPAFYYQTKDLRQKWHGHRIPLNGTYVLPSS